MLTVIKIGLPIALIALMFAQGLKLVPGQQLAVFKERPLPMLRSLLAILVLVPLAALGIVLWLKPAPAVGVGLAILASSPAAPFQLANIAKKGGSMVYLGAIHLSVAWLAVFTVPVVLYLFSEALGFRAEFGVLGVARVVGTLILLPVGLGILVNASRPAIADRIGPPIGKIAELVLYLLLIPILVKSFDLLLKMDAWSYFVMFVFILVNLTIGHVLGPSDPKERTTLAMECGARNIGLALTIGALNFSQEKALAVYIPYIVLFAVTSTVYLKWRAAR
jgi:BASS family bile acid:Na+ symporter